MTDEPDPVLPGMTGPIPDGRAGDAGAHGEGHGPAGEHDAKEPEPEVKAQDPPGWKRLDSDQGILPGDIVPGITDANRPLTEDDRAQLRTQLKKRLGQNDTQIDKLAAAVPRAVLEPWTAFVVEDMKEAMEDDAGWNIIAKALSFAVRAALMVAFPEEMMVEVFGHLGATLGEKGAEFGLELAGEAVGEKVKETRVDHEGEEIEKLVPAVALIVTTTLAPAIEAGKHSRHYEEWLDQAPLPELWKFRVPSLLKADEARIQQAVAAALAAVVHDEMAGVDVRMHGHWSAMGGLFGSGEQWSSQDNTITVGLRAPNGAGVPSIDSAPSFHGSHAIWRSLIGAKIADIPQVPLLTTLTAQKGPWSDLITGFPTSGPAKIKRYTDGLIAVDDGGLEELLFLYRVAHPDEDERDILHEYLSDSGEPGEVPEEGEHHLAPAYRTAQKLYWERLHPGAVEGAEFLLRQAVEPLSLPGSPAKEGHGGHE